MFAGVARSRQQGSGPRADRPEATLNLATKIIPTNIIAQQHVVTAAVVTVSWPYHCP